MTDNEFTMFVFLGLIAAYAVFLRFQVRGLRHKLERLALAGTAPQVEIAPGRKDAQIDELKSRIQVLERITTDGNRSLDREIEALRQA